MGLDVEKIENMSFVLLYLLKKGSGETSWEEKKKG